MRRGPIYGIMMASALLMAVSCASIGNPSGGPRDEDPPRFLYSSPMQGAVEVTPTKAVLTFDEIVNVKDAFTNVVVSPPSAQAPRVSSLGRRVTVEFRDTLLPNTTYTVDFGSAIVDNNEGNKLENFFYTFSTGPVLDSLMVSGMVLDAQDLTPPAGMYVGLHSNLEDSAFRKTRFDRIAKTDENGKFVIGGLAPGKYRIYALDDRDGDLAWSSPDETLAFYDTVLEPVAENAVATDTIFNLTTGEVDSIVTRQRVKYLPNNILLRSYNTGYKQQYITKYERQDSTKLNFIFNAEADSMPMISVIAGERTFPISDIAITERSATNDTLTFWLKAPEVINTDTLRVAMRYLRADSVYNMVPVNDTLRMIVQRPIIKEKKEKKEKKEEADTVAPPVPTLTIIAATSKVEVNLPIALTFPEPLDTIDLSAIHLNYKPDSVFVAVEGFGPANMRFDSLNPRKLIIEFPWDYETQYQLKADSLAARGIYGLYTAPLTTEFTTRKDSEYGSIQFNLKGYSDSIPRFVELLGPNGNPMRSLPVADGKVTFEYLLAGKYNARVVEDSNGNGKWDPGNFDTGLQPDIAYYYPETIELKQNWSQEIDWDVFAKPVDKMVPETLRKKSSNNNRR